MKMKRNNEAGMTLLELMIAAGIMATALSMLFGSLISINVIGKISEDKALATTQVAGLLEHVRSLTYEDLLPYSPPMEITSPGVKQKVVIECYDEDGGTYALPITSEGSSDTITSYTEIPTLPNPMDVKITLVWQNEQGHILNVYATTQHRR